MSRAIDSCTCLNGIIYRRLLVVESQVRMVSRLILIISHKYKFIFIKTAKTAGTSIEVFLSRHCGEEDIVCPIYPKVAPHTARNYRGVWNPLPEITSHDCNGDTFSTLKQLVTLRKYYDHIPARNLKYRLPREIWNGYLKFCIERNPWDKTLSHYWMHNYRAGGRLTLDEYLARGKFALNYPRYTDRNGNLLVDNVIKYESLEDGLGEVFSKLSIPFEGTLGVQAKSEYRQDRTPYQKVFTEQQRRFIAKIFSHEIEMHGYAY